MKILWQTMAISILSIIMAIGFNELRPDALPLFCPWSQSAVQNTFSGKVGIISIKEAAALFHADQAVFIDARPEFAYDQGHIQGALCLPWEAAEDKCFDVVTEIPEGKKIITYCDGATCDLCDHLAIFLRDLGFEDVQALTNGWSLWQQHGLPAAIPETAMQEH